LWILLASSSALAATIFGVVHLTNVPKPWDADERTWDVELELAAWGTALLLGIVAIVCSWAWWREWRERHKRTAVVGIATDAPRTELTRRSPVLGGSALLLGIGGATVYVRYPERSRRLYVPQVVHRFAQSYSPATSPFQARE
jgi:hypothetical protein